MYDIFPNPREGSDANDNYEFDESDVNNVNKKKITIKKKLNRAFA